MRFRLYTAIYCLTSVSMLAAQTVDIAAVRRSAEAGDPKAEYELAKAYNEGKLLPMDKVQGFRWLQKAAADGYPGAEVTLGYIFQNGYRDVGVQRDPHEAAKWYRKAAKSPKTSPTDHNAQNAQADLAALASQGLISIQEADWRASEPGSEPGKPTKQAKEPLKTEPAKNESAKNESAKNKSAAFSLNEVETGLNGGITAKRMATLVSQYGVDFSLNASSKKRLTDDGADDNLLQVIASGKR